MKEIERTLGHEGGFSDDPEDCRNWTSGKQGVGALRGTNYGISAKSFPELDIKAISKEVATEIYKKRYWKPMKLEMLTSAKVRWKVFDIGVEMGSGTAIRMLQDIIGIHADGTMGSNTAREANDMDETRLLEGLLRAQVMRYASIVEKNTIQAKYLNGWIRRAFDVGEGL